ncbi:unannotated protein [freshwater metagenome]|uniref:Unannotated protein n=1 Tax=freshwater metagenome TaxID=449393 RepID=A0A6J7N2A0_9ZZZZ
MVKSKFSSSAIFLRASISSEPRSFIAIMSAPYGRMEATFSAGASARMQRIPGRPARAPYALIAAPPFPEEVPSHPRRPCESASIIVVRAMRSLYEPVGLRYSALAQILFIPHLRANVGNKTKGVLPSPIERLAGVITVEMQLLRECLRLKHALRDA